MTTYTPPKYTPPRPPPPPGYRYARPEDYAPPTPPTPTPAPVPTPEPERWWEPRPVHVRTHRKPLLLRKWFVIVASLVLILVGVGIGASGSAQPVAPAPGTPGVPAAAPAPTIEHTQVANWVNQGGLTALVTVNNDARTIDPPNTTGCSALATDTQALQATSAMLPTSMNAALSIATSELSAAGNSCAKQNWSDFYGHIRVGYPYLQQVQIDALRELAS